MNVQDYSKLANEKWNNWIKERGIQIFAVEPDLEKFLALGRKEMQYFLEPNKAIGFNGGYNDNILKNYINSARIQDLFDLPLGNLSMCEFGCGAGRLSIPFSKEFRHVYAYDISEEATKLAQNIATKFDIKNITFINGERLITNLPEKVDFIFSYIVLQHISNKETIETSITDISNSLKDNGIAKIHVRLTNNCYGNETDCFAGWGLPRNQAIEYYTNLCKSLNIELIEMTTDGGNDAGFITIRK